MAKRKINQADTIASQLDGMVLNGYKVDVCAVCIHCGMVYPASEKYLSGCHFCSSQCENTYDNLNPGY